MERKNIEQLYKLLERVEKERDAKAAAALRWAIFKLENCQKYILNSAQKTRATCRPSWRPLYIDNQKS